MGPYCKYCDKRCFEYADGLLVATCTPDIKIVEDAIEFMERATAVAGSVEVYTKLSELYRRLNKRS